MCLYPPTPRTLRGMYVCVWWGGGGRSNSTLRKLRVCVGGGGGGETRRNISNSVEALRACLSQIYIVKSWCRTCMRSLSSKHETVKLLSVQSVSSLCSLFPIFLCSLFPICLCSLFPISLYSLFPLCLYSLFPL